MLRHEEEGVRSQAILTLALMEPRPKDAAPALSEALRAEQNPSRFQLAAAALANADRQAAAAALTEVSRQGSREICSLAVAVLEELHRGDHLPQSDGK
jgi:hypothetical protein